MLDSIIEQKIEPGIDYMEIVRDWLRKTKIGNREDMITAVLISSNIGDRKQAEQLVDDVLNNKKEN